jgi:maltose alpha-D-glucosyltransferase/alpha-amylase
VLLGQGDAAPIRREDREALIPWAVFWTRWVGAAFLRAYLERAAEAPLVPKDGASLAALLDIYLLEKALYEIGYELQNRPDWLGVALDGIERLLGAEASTAKGGDE